MATEVTFEDILLFASGSKTIPPLGMKLFLEFLYYTEKTVISPNSQKQTHVPECTLSLPVTHKSSYRFKEALLLSFLNTLGFSGRFGASNLAEC